MNSNEFRVFGKELIDYICDYLDNIGERKVVPDVEPGYLSSLLPKESPVKGEEWPVILKDFDDKIMTGVTHWQHPHFHAHFANGNGYPSIIGDMLSTAIGCVGFSWAASPSCTELETIVLDWLGKALDIPPTFLFSTPNSKGGGTFQPSASDCILVSMLVARAEAIKYLKATNGTEKRFDSEFLHKLVAYCSSEAESYVQKAAMISFVRLRILESDEHGILRGYILEKAIKEDVEAGLHPFFISAVMGTTGNTSFDDLTELGQIAEKVPACWFHVDGANAGGALLCPENRWYSKGLEYAHSFNIDCNKWMLVAFDCSCFWVKDRVKLTSALTMDPLYLQNTKSSTALDYRHWGVPVSRRFRSLKLWFTMRNYGIEGHQEYIRNLCRIAKYFEKLVREDPRFEICNDVKLSLVCFRLKGCNMLNQKLLESLNDTGKMYVSLGHLFGKFFIRFCINYQYTRKEHIDKSWSLIQENATSVIKAHTLPVGKMARDHKPLNLLDFDALMVREGQEKCNRRNLRYGLLVGAAPILPIDEEKNEV